MSRVKREPLPAAAAVRLAAKTVGGWLAATIFLLTISGALPAAINKICRATNRSVRITSGHVPVRVDRRVDVIEPDVPHGLTAEQIREDEDFASAEAAASRPPSTTIIARVARHNLPYRAAPFLARADVIRPSERQSLSLRVCRCVRRPSAGVVLPPALQPSSAFLLLKSLGFRPIALEQRLPRVFVCPCIRSHERSAAPESLDSLPVARPRP